VTTGTEPRTPADPPTGARLAADLADVDLTSGRSFVDGVPHAAFDALRAAGGVSWHHEPPPDPAFDQGDMLRFVESPGFWVVTRHDLVTEVLRDQGRFSSALGGTTMPSLAPESLAMFRQMMLNMDPPEHVRLRRILQPIFTPRAVERLHASVAANAAEIVADLADLADTDECDLVTAVSAEMPLRVLADLLGMPRGDRHLIFEWSNALIGFDNPDADRHVEEAIGAFAELLAYGQTMAEARRAEPLDDVVSRIVHAEVDGERLDGTEFAMFWLLLVVAGNETTRNALSGAVIALQEHDRWSWLRAHPDRLPVAVEELLRYVSPVMQFRRTATAATVLGDQGIRAGDKVVVWYGAANRDPAVFADPHTLDFERDPNPHLAFGVGPHFCLGAHLARLEIAEMLGHLLARAPDLSIAGPATRVGSNFINGISRLPVRLGPAR
jgi:cytochrome P450